MDTYLKNIEYDEHIWFQYNYIYKDVLWRGTMKQRLVCALVHASVFVSSSLNNQTLKYLLCTVKLDIFKKEYIYFIYE